MVTSFTDEVKKSGLVKRILTLLKEINVDQEIEQIDHNPQLKGVVPKYLREVCVVCFIV